MRFETDWYVIGTGRPQVIENEVAEEVRFEHPPLQCFQCLQSDTKELTASTEPKEQSSVRYRYTAAAAGAAGRVC